MSVYDFDNQQQQQQHHNHNHHHQQQQQQQQHQQYVNNNRTQFVVANNNSYHLNNGTTQLLTSNTRFQVSNNNNNNQQQHHHFNRAVSIPITNSTSTTPTNHIDMSTQLTRPTSKTALLVRQRRAMLEQISCFICKGYLIDATTLDECMDSFCKSCIVTYLRSNSNCPKCNIYIQKTDPLSSIRSDKVLQDIVYKLVPGLYDNEMKRRRDFYKNLYGSSSDEDDTDGSSSSGRFHNLTGERYGVVSHPKPFYKPLDNIDLSIEPQTRNDSSGIYYDNKRKSIVTCFTGKTPQDEVYDFSLVDSQHFKTYLRCPAKFTVLQLKKFIAAKFNICRFDTIHLLYLNESLKDKYSLIDIAYIYDWRGIEHMRLYYIIERDLSRDDLHLCLNNERASKVKTRPSVGTSTANQVKRVCIDPSPKFYREESDHTPDTNGLSNTNGRSMRSRTTVDSPKIITATRNVSTAQQTSPILRSSSSSTKPEQQNVQTLNNNAKEVQKISYSQIRYIPYPNNLSGMSVTGYQKPAYKIEDPVDSPNTSNRSSTGASSAVNMPNRTANTNSFNRQQNNDNNYQTYSKSKPEEQRLSKEMVSRVDAGQIVPYVSRVGPHPGASTSTTTTTNTTTSGPNQGSLVTLASFTEARSEHVVAMSSSTAATISSSYGNILSADSSSSHFMKPTMNIANNQMMMGQTNNQARNSPQLAFSIVTERGITIVRRMNGSDQAPISSIASKPANVQSNNSQSPTMATSSSPGSSTAQTISSMSSQVASKSPASSTNNSTQSSHTSNNVTSPRHNLKVKPVYKTFVDPTKLKTPNYKKFSYTARH